MKGPPRDLVGYADRPPDPAWPKGARVAVNLVVNYEEGAENSVLLGDPHHETLLSDLGPFEPLGALRHGNIESLYEYGSRVGFWRILRAIQDRGLAFTVNAVGLALTQNSAAVEAIKAADCDVLSHGWRWIDYFGIDEAVEREHMRLCVVTLEKLFGERPIGWYTGRPSENTRRLVVEEGGFLYDSDAYNDDLPYWNHDYGRPHLVVPYAFDTNDSRFTRSQGFDVADDCYSYLKDTFDCLYREGQQRGSMMTVGLHARLIGRPGRIAALERFLDYIMAHDEVWVCQRNAIALHWIDRHPPESS